MVDPKEHWSEVWAREIRPKIAELRYDLYNKQFGNNMVDIKDLKKKARWYLKYRTQIWSTVFLIVGVLGGSAATIQAWIPTLKTDTETIEKKLENIQEAIDKLQK